MATFGRWEIRGAAGTWAQPDADSPNPFEAGPYQIASWTSVAVYGPGFTGDEGNIFVLGSLYKNSPDTHIWRYNSLTNVWTYVISWSEGFDVQAVVAAYGYGLPEFAVEPTPYILFATCDVTSGRNFPNSGGISGRFLFFYYLDVFGVLTPQIDLTTFEQDIYNPQMCWDGSGYIWMWGEGEGNPVLYYSDGFSWSNYFIDDSGTPDVDYPRVRKDALFTYVQPTPGSAGKLLLSHGIDDTTYLDTTWTFGGSWDKHVGATPSARARAGGGSIGSNSDGVTALIVGGETGPGVYLDEVWAWDEGWTQLDDFPFGSEYNMRCCGKMENGYGIPVG